MKQVLEQLKRQGIAVCLDGDTLVVENIPPWSLFRLVRKYWNELYQIEMTRVVMNSEGDQRSRDRTGSRRPAQ